jgi:hypothetical protein
MTVRSSTEVKVGVASSSSPIKKTGRKILANLKLQYSPKMKTPNVNKVYVVGAKLGLILLRTQRFNNTVDAFTHPANLTIEDQETGVASRLKIIKICNRRQYQMIDKAIFQSTAYASVWYVSLTEESNNTVEYHRDHAYEFIEFMNETKWIYPQTFVFQGDETKYVDDKIVGTWDMYCLNSDNARLLKEYFYDDKGNFLEDEDALKAVFGEKCTAKQASDCLKDAWLSCIL